MTITPLIVGSGMAGRAAANAFKFIAGLNPELGILAPQWLKRGSPLARKKSELENPVLVIANPHGLHAQTLLEADTAGFPLVICEKPSCVTLEQMESLKKVKARVAVLHVYRQMWGPQAIKAMLARGEFGELISIEGKYWQSSSAEKALKGQSRDIGFNPGSDWKSDPRMTGAFDVIIDIGCHWVDLACYFYGAMPERLHAWKSYKNAQAAHRDTHTHLTLEFANDGRALASVSKTAHGAANDLEITVIGTKKSVTWAFLKPDELLIGEGRERRVVVRRDSELGSQMPPFHGLGWLEGYIEIIHQALREQFKGKKADYPRLAENLRMMELLLQASA